MIRFTLMTDGRSDKVLLNHILWLLGQHTDHTIEPTWAPPRHSTSLRDRIAATLVAYPCDLLCIHRDAEHEPYEVRRREIEQALSGFAGQATVCIVPVRMTEAWLLFDAAAIRQAAGNPSGTEPRSLPSLKTIEREPNPKAVLHSALKEASGLGKYRKQRLHPHELVGRVGELIEDFSPLRQLSAFRSFEAEIVTYLHHRGLTDLSMGK